MIRKSSIWITPNIWIKGDLTMQPENPTLKHVAAVMAVTALMEDKGWRGLGDMPVSQFIRQVGLPVAGDPRTFEEMTA